MPKSRTILASLASLEVFLIVGVFLFQSCSPKIVESIRTEYRTEYRDRIVHDTVSVEIPVEVERNVTRDTVSHLENSFAKSDAVVSGGLLHHSLESKPQIVKVPVTVVAHDTLIVQKDAEIRTETKLVEKPLTQWQKFRLRAFWGLLAAWIVFLAWKYRKPLLAMVRRFI